METKHMRWYQDFYCSDNLKGSKKQIRKMVEKGWHLRPLFMIVLSDLPDGQLEIIPAVMLKNPFLKDVTYDVIGVAKGYYYARTVVEQIFGQVYQETGACNVKQYFQERMKEGESA
jgi:hypothetical protein